MSTSAAAAIYRDEILETLKDRLLAKLNKSLEEGREQETSDTSLGEIRTQYGQHFSNFLSTAFDVVFRDELKSKNSEPNQKALDELNLSVSDNDLQSLDDAVTTLCRRRKIYPGKCASLLEQTLQSEVEAAKRIRTSIKSVPNVSDESLPIITSDASCDGVLSELQSDARNAIDKSRRVETAANILIDAKDTLNNIGL